MKSSLKNSPFEAQSKWWTYITFIPIRWTYFIHNTGTLSTFSLMASKSNELRIPNLKARVLDVRRFQMWKEIPLVIRTIYRDSQLATQAL